MNSPFINLTKKQKNITILYLILLIIIRFGSTYICEDESIKNVHFGKISQYLNSLLVKQYSTYCKNGYNLVPKLKLTETFLTEKCDDLGRVRSFSSYNTIFRVNIRYQDSIITKCNYF